MDEVYAAHDQGMVFVAIMWAVFLALIFGYGLARRLAPPGMTYAPKDGEQTSMRQSTSHRLMASTSAALRRYTTIETPLRKLFGRTTRLQVLILAALSAYLIVFSFVGFSYQVWVTPHSELEGVYNTRSSLGPWSDRVGVMAYALIPLSVLLANRESLLSLITGVPYQNFNFLHRWLGYIIYIQSTMHTIGWTVIEAWLYKPQPSVWNNWVAQKYAIWGVVAMVLLTVMVVLSLPWGIRLTGYEAFRKMHYVFAAVFMGACYGHWAQLGCFMIASLVIWFLDRSARLVRSFLIHYQYLPHSASAMGFQSTPTQIECFPDDANGDVVRLDFLQSHAPWQAGQHFYLCFPESSVWQSHPFTPLSLPGVSSDMQQHSYIFRAKSGETKKIADIARTKATSSISLRPKSLADSNSSRSSTPQPLPTTPVIITGPYGVSHVSSLMQSPSINVLCIAGGTGITFVLPILLHLLKAPTLANTPTHRRIELIWVVRLRQDIQWVKRELDMLRTAEKRLNLRITIFVTREQVDGEKSDKSSINDDAKGLPDLSEKQTTSPPPALKKQDDADIHVVTSSSFSQSQSQSQSLPTTRRFSIEHSHTTTGHPDVSGLVDSFLSETVCGPTQVFASGPGGMITELRRVVAERNDVGRVWKGDERGSVELVCDDRIEW